MSRVKEASALVRERCKLWRLSLLAEEAGFDKNVLGGQGGSVARRPRGTRVRKIDNSQKTTAHELVEAVVETSVDFQQSSSDPHAMLPSADAKLLVSTSK